MIPAQRGSVAPVWAPPVWLEVPPRTPEFSKVLKAPTVPHVSEVPQLSEVLMVPSILGAPLILRVSAKPMTPEGPQFPKGPLVPMDASPVLLDATSGLVVLGDVSETSGFLCKICGFCL